MRLVIVIRSYAGRRLEFGPIVIGPWKFVEVPYSEFKKLPPDVAEQLTRSKLSREIAIQLVADDKPVDEMNEDLVLRMYDESQGASHAGA
jgi:hypothetical protein